MWANLHGLSSRVASTWKVLAPLFVAPAAVGAEPVVPPSTGSSWWSHFQQQCAPLLTGTVQDGPVQVALLTTALLVVWLFYRWVALMKGRLPAVCVSVDVDGRPVPPANLTWVNARGRIRRKMIAGFASIHDVAADKSGTVKGVLTIVWCERPADVTVLQRLVVGVDEGASERRKWLRRWLGGGNVIMKLSLPLQSIQLRILTEPKVGFEWRRPQFPADVNMSTTRVAFSYRVEATYTTAGDDSVRTFLASVVSKEEIVRVELPDALAPETIPKWSVEATLAGVVGAARHGSPWGRKVRS